MSYKVMSGTVSTRLEDKVHIQKPISRGRIVERVDYTPAVQLDALSDEELHMCIRNAEGRSNDVGSPKWTFYQELLRREA